MCPFSFSLFLFAQAPGSRGEQSPPRRDARLGSVQRHFGGLHRHEGDRENREAA